MGVHHVSERNVIEVELDSRKRLPLAKLLRGRGAKRYLVTPQEDGRIILTPMVSVQAPRE